MVNILVVEDEQGVAHFIRQGLEEEGYVVDLAVDGNEGTAFAGRGRYDLIVLDVMLPGIDGIELCRHVREMDVHTPVLMLTAKDSVKDKVRGLNSGADDYLTKPFSFEEFLARCRALLRRKEERLTELIYEDLRADIISHRVFVGDREVFLRPKEYAVLLYLLKNPGRALSRSEMLAHVWGYDFNPNTNFVDVHIKALREKLAEHSQTNFIRSVRGVGYMLGD